MGSENVAISDLMSASGVAFGTSGARGLVRDMTDRVCVAYTLGFLGYLDHAYASQKKLAIGGDKRPSTERIMRAVSYAATTLGYEVAHLGELPSPAVALFGLREQCPTVMVTGSHIPADRNGMKYTTLHGEFSKADEAGMLSERVVVPASFDAEGHLNRRPELGVPLEKAKTQYLDRYLDAFPKNCLTGLRVGVYGHSSVAREILCELYGILGAEILRFGYSDEFVPVDTEAIRDEDVELARAFAAETRVDAIVSTDGADEFGNWFRGDIAGPLTARFFDADGVVCPVSCNSALEESGYFAETLRTRIGSPFVIEGMGALRARGRQRVVGYEANGGFLTASPLPVPGGGTLPPLATRDPIIVHLALLLAARAKNGPLSALRNTLPARYTASGRDVAFSNQRSRELLERLRSQPSSQLAQTLKLGPLERKDETDGLRFYFANGEILHFRPSGNAPELRCYAEASSSARAETLVEQGLANARDIAPA
jgi:phosphomannomutase